MDAKLINSTDVFSLNCIQCRCYVHVAAQISLLAAVSFDIYRIERMCG